MQRCAERAARADVRSELKRWRVLRVYPASWGPRETMIHIFRPKSVRSFDGSAVPVLPNGRSGESPNASRSHRPPMSLGF
jgi:hypothetical protein